MHHNQGQCRQKFYQVISVGHRVHTVQCGTLKSQQRRRVPPVQGIGGACQRTGPQRTVVHPVVDILQPLAVPLEHFKVSPIVMGQGGGLGLLQVSKARHVGFHIGFHGIQNHGHQFL